MPQYELNLRDYLRIFHKRKFIIFIVFFGITIGAATHVSMQPPVYRASTTVKILERQNLAGLLTEWIVFTPADLMESQAKIVKGFPIIKKVAFRLGLIDEGFSTPEINNVVTGLQSRINTDTVAQTNIIEITATAGSGKEAMDLANEVAQVYVEENLLEKKKQASSARQFIEEQLFQLEERLRDGEERLRKLGDEVKGIRLAEPIQKKLVELEFELAALLQKYTHQHPRIIQLKEEIKDLEAQLKNFSGQEMGYARLVREVEVNKKLYGMLKEKFEEARINEAQKIGDVSIVDPAVMPKFPVFPRKKVVVLMSGIAGLMLGVILAFVAETMDTSIGTIEDVENLLRVPVIGVIPSASSDIKEKSTFTRFKRRILPVAKSEAEEDYIRLIVHHKPKSPITEAFRNIRTNLNLNPSNKTILLTSAGPREGKTTIMANLGLTVAQKGAKILLTSSDLRRPSLAKSFGMDREPGLAEVIIGTVKLEDALRSVSDIMLGDMRLEELMKTPGMENLWILPSGHLPLNPAELLESENLPKLIKELRERFEVVFFDSPPVLPVTDASLLAPKVDSVVLVYEVGRTARGALSRAKVQLESVGAKVLGVVLNHIAPQTETIAPYPYYYKYKYRYYGKEEKETRKGAPEEKKS